MTAHGPDPFENFPILRTDRLTMRDLRPEDAVEIHRMRANRRMNRFLARQDMHDPLSATDLVQQSINAWKSRQAIVWGLLLRDQEQISAMGGLYAIDLQNRRAEIAGEVDVRYWGKRIAVECCKAMTDHGIRVLGLHSIEAQVDARNRGAIALLEHLGYVKEAHFKDRLFFNGDFHDVVVYTRIGDR